jgi:DNA-binding CsgD family transcriptional regulator
VIGLESISARALSDAIGSIYDCALDPQRWPDTIRQISELCESAAGGMCVHHLKSIENDHLFVYGYQPGFTDHFEKFYMDSPMAAAVPTANVGEVATIAMIANEWELPESRFYLNVIEPYGYIDYIGLIALRTGERIASVHATRTRHHPRYGEREIGLMNLMSPHICRALTISDALDISTLRSEMLEATLDGLLTGVYLTARDGRVVYMNGAAQRQIKTGNALRVVSNRLYPTDAKARAALANAIDDMARDETAQLSVGNSLAIPDVGGTGYIATLLPVERGRRESILAPFAASVAVFVQDPVHVPLFPGEAFARLYGLTGGELRVLLALAQGLGATEAADMLGIGATTVKTHLQNLFAKTGTSKQVELLLLLTNSTPPTQAA